MCLSPSINSLCPLPIGIIASKHNGPICKGSNTDCLSIIPTAGDSMTYWFLDDMLRVPNNCDPNGSNKDPTTKSPSITAAKLFDPITFPPSYVLTSGCSCSPD